MNQRSYVFRLGDAQTRLPGPAGEHSVSVLRHGTLDARLAKAPPKPTELTEHEQDEVYVVVSGRGVLFHDGKRDTFEAGDLLFVSAGTPHRFEAVSSDLAVWVIFYGRPGGEGNE